MHGVLLKLDLHALNQMNEFSKKIWLAKNTVNERNCSFMRRPTDGYKSASAYFIAILSIRLRHTWVQSFLHTIKSFYRRKKITENLFHRIRSLFNGIEWWKLLHMKTINCNRKWYSILFEARVLSVFLHFRKAILSIFYQKNIKRSKFFIDISKGRLNISTIR